MQRHWKLVTWLLGLLLLAFLAALAMEGFAVAGGIVVGAVVCAFVYFIGRAPLDGRPSDESDPHQNPQNSSRRENH